ncbi:MAG: phosphoenolpyruvate--protein phosphotransferase [Elusimicrobia bacterium]|nr:phosphoenolpyruvate--protein phosphotransferase [Elusimicrobiota bacterium]
MLYKGSPASPGIAIGRVFLLEDEEFCAIKRTISKEGIRKEIERFKRAIVATKNELNRITNKATKHLSKKHVKLFEAYLFIVDDPVFKEDVISRITKGLVNAEYALQEVTEKNLKVFEKIEDEYFKQRGNDVLDVSKKIMRHMVGAQKKTLAETPEDSIVFTHNLTPTDTITMKDENILGFATNMGGKTSHTAIMAQAMEIPAVVGLKDITSHVKHGDSVIIDGTEGVVVINPDEDTLANYKRMQQRFITAVKELNQFVDLPAVTTDGKKIVVASNIEIPQEIKSVISHGAEGIGLFRTEYLFLNRKTLPSETEQFESYKNVVEKIFPNPVIIRTVDLGGDKLFHNVEINKERNPFLGLRAIRLCLKHPEMFKKQLRAILRASAFGNVKLMYPMISGVDELRAANAVLSEVKQELKSKSIQFDENIEVGIMIEIPSAALTVDVLAKEADFLSIGTNDLIQYTLAVDRINEYVTHLYEPLHLSVLRLLKNIINAGHRAGKWVSMCGEMAGDPSYTEILLGLGLEHFSVVSASVLRIKKEIRKTNFKAAKKITDEILSESSRDLLVKKIKQRKSLTS